MFNWRKFININKKRSCPSMFHPVGLRLYYYWTASTSTGPNGRQLWWCCPCSGLSTHIVAHNRNSEQGYGVLFTRPSLARYWVIMQHETRSLALRALAATRPCATSVTLDEGASRFNTGGNWGEFSADEGQGIKKKERFRYHERSRTNNSRLVAQVIKPSSKK